MALTQPFPEDFTDADGYTDYEAYDDAWTRWQDCKTYEEQPPYLGEFWCKEEFPKPAAPLEPWQVELLSLLELA